MDIEAQLLKAELARFMRRLYKQNLTTTSGGNISAMLSDGKVLVTPSGSDKGRMRANEIGLMGPDGEILSGDFRPSIESRMHLAVYKARPDVKAIVHAHPVTASAFAAASIPIQTRLLSESRAIIGELASTNYEFMGTDALAESVARAAANADCVLMGNHGALAVGRSLLEAFDRLEVLEAAAKITLIHMGPLREFSKPLPPNEIERIDKFMGRKA